MRISDWSSDVCSSDLRQQDLQHLSPVCLLLDGRRALTAHQFSRINDLYLALCSKLIQRVGEVAGRNAVSLWRIVALRPRWRGAGHHGDNQRSTPLSLRRTPLRLATIPL